MQPPPDREHAIAALAARQGGVVARDQLVALGLGRDAVDSRVRRGRLHRVRYGVYAVGHPGLGPDGHLHAALLDTGAGAVLSHRTAAALWELLPRARPRVEVTVTRGGRRGDRGLQVHQVRTLDPRDVTRRDDLPVTTVARTLLDLAEVVPEAVLARAVEEAVILRCYDGHAVADVLARANGRRGAPRLRRAIAALTDRPPDLRSELEREFRDFCLGHQLPLPAANVAIAGFLVDAVWPAARLVVELDGRGVHHTPQAFERDRRRDRALAVAGYRVVRVTREHLRHDGPALAGDLAHLLAEPGPPGR